MSGFEHFARDAEDLEREIVKRGIALGIDWSDQARLREYAQEALNCTPECNWDMLHSPDRQERMRAELYALSVLMLRTMTESAELGIHTHGGPAWKAFGRALIEASERGAGRVQPASGAGAH